MRPDRASASRLGPGRCGASNSEIARYRQIGAGIMRGCVVVAAVCAAIVLAASGSTVNGQSSALVRVTPLGSHAGELCRNDRAMLFEDPTGVRILYDPGRTVDET